MRNYKALKSASKVSVRKQKIVDRAAEDAVAEVRNDDGNITTHSQSAQAEESHDELQLVKKCFNSDTGVAMDDSVKSYSLSEVKGEIDRCKSEVVKQQADQSEWKALETDLKAL